MELGRFNFRESLRQLLMGTYRGSGVSQNRLFAERAAVPHTFPWCCSQGTRWLQQHGGSSQRQHWCMRSAGKVTLGAAWVSVTFGGAPPYRVPSGPGAPPAARPQEPGARAPA